MFSPLSILCLVSSALSLTVVSPPSLAADIESPILSSHVGSQAESVSAPDNLPSFELRRVEFGHACLQDTAVFISNNTIILLELVSDFPSGTVAEIECLQSWGAPGVVVLARHFPRPGAVRYDSRLSSRSLTIPVLHAGNTRAMAAVVEYLKLGEGDVFIQFVATPNPWQVELWHTTMHLVFYNLGLPIMNAINVVLAVDGLVGQIRLIRSLRRRRHASIQANLLPASGCAIESVVCAIRVGYFSVGGPFKSGPGLSHAAHVFVVNTTYATGTLTGYIAAALFLSWIYGSTRSSLTFKYLQLGLLAIGIMTFFAGLAASSLEAEVGPSLTITQVVHSMGTIVVFVSSVAFLWAGFVFTRMLRSRKAKALNNAAWRDQALQKAVFWMMVGAVAQDFQLIALVYTLVHPNSLRHPVGHFVLFGSMCFGSTLASAAHVLSFRPMTQTRVGIISCVLDLIRKPPKAPSLGQGSAQAIYPDSPELS